MAVMEMREIKEPKLVSFAKDGEVAEGVLQAIDVVEMAQKDDKGNVTPGLKKKVARFVLLEGHMNLENGEFEQSGDRLCFLGSRQIIDALKMSHVGHFVVVRFEGVDPTIGRNGNAMKRFKVWVSSARPVMNAPLSAADGLGITDADIPF